MARVESGTRYSLVYVVFHTLFHLTTRDGQVRCFGNAARHLRPDASFVLETFLPDLSRFPRDRSMMVKGVEVDRVQFHLPDRPEQRVASQDDTIQGKGVTLSPNQIRFAWPSELDLMARLAGLRLSGRYGGWDKRPFRPHTSSICISVYQRVARRTRVPPAQRSPWSRKEGR